MFDGDDDTSGDRDPGERLASAYPEPDPEADWPDPETELPNVPSVEIPTPGTSETEVPGELLAGFWTTVLVFNVALLATSLGVLLLAFGVRRRLGTAALLVGIFAAAHGYWKYRSLAERHRSGEWTGGSLGEDSPAPSTDEPAAPPPVEQDERDDESTESAGDEAVERNG